MIGERLSHFRIIDKIGEGGMGVVYRAEDENLGRRVALKVLPEDFVQDEQRRARFEREARMAAAVTHPNIATIHGIDEVDGSLFISMELVEGKNLHEVIDGRPMRTDDALDVAVRIAAGMARAHKAGIVHRDLKPDNILVTEDGDVKILDFGLAKPYETDRKGGDSDVLPTISAGMTQEGRILGTVSYMSPEQARGLSLDARSDVFSFGVVLYEMITGRKPFAGDTVTDTLSSILRDPQPPIARFNPEVPAELERILARCLEKDAERRYQDTGELVDELRNLKRATDSQSVTLPKVTFSGERAAETEPARLRPVAWVVAAAAVLALALVLPRLMEGGTPPPVPEPIANSLAVMPFENLESPEDPQRLGQILQELMITDLSAVGGGFRVFSSQRLYDLQKQLGRETVDTIDRDMAIQVARQAGASTMLTGSLGKHEGSWILTTRLVDVTDGTVIRSLMAEGSDLYVMVDELTPDVRGGLGIALASSPDEDMAVREKTSGSLQAYERYLQGVELLNDLEFAEAEEALRDAVELDPEFGRARFKLALARWWHQDTAAPLDETESGPAASLLALRSGEFKLSHKEALLVDASIALVQRRFLEAQSLYERVLGDYPDEKEAWYGLGEARYHAVGGFADTRARNAFEEAIRLDPAYRLAYFHVVDSYQLHGDHDAGIRLTRALVEQDPSNPRWHQQYASLVAEGGDEDDAAKAMDRCLTALDDPGDRQQLLIGVSQAYAKRGFYGRSREVLDRALAMESDEPNTKLLNELGWVALRSGRHDEAETWFEDSLESARSENLRALRGLARLALARGDTDTALRYAERLRDETPGTPTGHMVVHEVLVFAGREVEAERHLERALELVDSEPGRWELYKNAANPHLVVGDHERAAHLLQRARNLDPQGRDPFAGLGIGWAHLIAGRLDEATVAIRSSQEKAPWDAEVAWAAAASDLLHGQAEAAEAGLKRWLDERPSTGALLWLTAHALAEQGKFEEAEAYAREAVEVAPGRPSLTALSWVLVAGDIDVAEGLELARESSTILPPVYSIAERLPFLPSPEHCLGLALLRQGDFAEAAAALEEALRIQPDRKLVRVHLDQAEAKQVAALGG